MAGTDWLGEGILVFDVPEIPSEYGKSLCEIHKGILQEIRLRGLAPAHRISSPRNNLATRRKLRGSQWVPTRGLGPGTAHVSPREEGRNNADD